MDTPEPEAGQLQLHDVVTHGSDGGVCVVRCVGGTPRPGQVFATKGLTGTPRLEWIERYGRFLEFLDPPHSVLVHLSDAPLVQLRHGDVLTSVTEPDTTALPGRLAPDWRGRLANCGLRLIGLATPDGLPEVLRAHDAARGHRARPEILVQDTHPDAGAELDLLWNTMTTATRLASPEGEFYVVPPDPRGHEIGWARVRDRVGTGLPSRVLAATGRAAFLAVSPDGRVLAAVTDEETGRRIVVRDDDWRTRPARPDD
ncbi:hypothetical protein [Streptomyces sp. NPDC012825]|uniref:hypothetical protein n=1 Tax=Streptomyces sp. NPDC012825 TaxID=3364851 RepID=UPI0036A68CC6